MPTKLDSIEKSIKSMNDNIQDLIDSDIKVEERQNHFEEESIKRHNEINSTFRELARENNKIMLENERLKNNQLATDSIISLIKEWVGELRSDFRDMRHDSKEMRESISDLIESNHILANKQKVMYTWTNILKWIAGCIAAAIGGVATLMGMLNMLGYFK